MESRSKVFWFQRKGDRNRLFHTWMVCFPDSLLWFYSTSWIHIPRSHATRKEWPSQVPVAYACHPSYFRGWDGEDLGLRPAWANSYWDSISKIAAAKWIGGVAQAVEHLFCKRKILHTNSRPTKKKKKKKKKREGVHLKHKPSVSMGSTYRLAQLLKKKIGSVVNMYILFFLFLFPKW
jgi:hypothetical protein